MAYSHKCLLALLTGQTVRLQLDLQKKVQTKKADVAKHEVFHYVGLPC
jgi:hypothetical protein